MKDLQYYAKSQKFDLNTLIFHGGEEYEIVFTISPKYKQIIKKNANLSLKVCC
jgi:thiamine-monophosphate kinase